MIKLRTWGTGYGYYKTLCNLDNHRRSYNGKHVVTVSPLSGLALRQWISGLSSHTLHLRYPLLTPHTHTHTSHPYTPHTTHTAAPGYNLLWPDREEAAQAEKEDGTDNFPQTESGQWRELGEDTGNVMTHGVQPVFIAPPPLPHHAAAQDKHRGGGTRRNRYYRGTAQNTIFYLDVIF